MLRTNRVTTVGCTTPLCMYTCTCMYMWVNWMGSVRYASSSCRRSDLCHESWMERCVCVTCCGVAESIVDLMSRRALVGRSLSPRWDRGRFCNIPRAIHLPERIFIGYESCRFLGVVRLYSLAVGQVREASFSRTTPRACDHREHAPRHCPVTP